MAPPPLTLAVTRLTNAATNRRLALILCFCVLLLGACGSSERTSSAASVPNPAPSPTPIPTTPPLFLPPADDTLPALAPLPDVLPAAAATPELLQENTVAAVDPVATAPAAVPIAIEPVAQETTAAPELVLITSTDGWDDCVLAAAEASGAAALLDPIAASVATDLSSVQLNSFAAQAAQCDVITSIWAPPIWAATLHPPPRA